MGNTETVKKKIAFVVVRYGTDINGGAELHCRMLAERLADRYDVEILTTCVKNYVSGINDLESGESHVNGILVRRFPVNPVNDGLSEYDYVRKAKAPRRLRQFLRKTGLLGFVSSIFPIWKWGYGNDVEALKHNLFHSPELDRYISENKDRYDVFIGITADYPPFYYTAMHAGEKMLAIPTLHDTKISYRSYLTNIFPQIKYTGFNTDAERKLAKILFGKGLKESGIISVGIESPEPAEWSEVKRKFGLPDKYFCYIGRIEKGKVGKLLEYHASYCRKNPGQAIPVVMVGQVFQDVGETADTIFTGFVSDSEKRAILMHAALLINPSTYESLSLIVLEALNDNVPVLVNGHCNALKEHCIRSGGAVKYYTGKKSFCKALKTVICNNPKHERMIKLGHQYYLENYSWDIIMPRLHKAIEYISGDGSGV